MEETELESMIPQCDDNSSDALEITNWQLFERFITDKLKETVGKIQEFWDALGMDSNDSKVRIQKLAIQLNELFEKMTNDERMHNHLIQKSVLDMAGQLEELASLLNYNMPIIMDISKKPLKLLDELNELFIELTTEKNNRINQYNELAKNIKEVCRLLDTTESRTILGSPFKRSKDEIGRKYIPTKEEITILKKQYDDLTNEMENRKNELKQIRSSIYDLLVKMGRNSQDPKYISIFNTKNQVLSRSFIDTIQRLHNELLDESTQCKQKYDSLWSEIEYWWDKLDTENVEREVIRARYRQNYGYDTIHELETIKRNIINERISKIGQCIEKQRKILKQILKKCYAFYNRKNADLWGGEEILDMAKTKFDPKSLVMNTEAYLVRLEKAVDVAKHYYNDNSSLYSMIQRREQLWDELCTFESTPLTSERLKNRGGILLKEEKIRRRIYKDLPALQEQLLIMLIDWKNKYKTENGIDDNGCKTRTLYWDDGCDYIERIRSQWDNRLKFHGKLNHPNESGQKLLKLTSASPVHERYLLSPRTPHSSMSSTNSSSIRQNRVLKRTFTPYAQYNTSSRIDSIYHNSPKTIQKTSQMLPKVPKLVLHSPITMNNNDNNSKTPLLPLPDISANQSVFDKHEVDIKSSKKATPLRKPQLN